VEEWFEIQDLATFKKESSYKNIMLNEIYIQYLKRKERRARRLEQRKADKIKKYSVYEGMKARCLDACEDYKIPSRSEYSALLDIVRNRSKIDETILYPHIHVIEDATLVRGGVSAETTCYTLNDFCLAVSSLVMN